MKPLHSESKHILGFHEKYIGTPVHISVTGTFIINHIHLLEATQLPIPMCPYKMYRIIMSTPSNIDTNNCDRSVIIIFIYRPNTIDQSGLNI